ncbi:hypothetical protein OV203_26005 [Nannocystis sp. ILAH1]|uniref:hypothetical protein n=1 Tax=Nannocystis sp. ILAH1 TaxID=2996789 RepID=UPI002271F784|nr:hypothetical protein [Nannocystis sp. ILAH1]MCY0990624.1 hypothetical protein [Nannocystis sp. ILAH1]
MLTSWLIGSRYLPPTPITIEGNVYDFSSASQGWYLYHPTGALSLVGRLQALLLSVPIAGASVVILRNRKVRISADGNFSITWTDAILRNLLGFSANLSGQSSYTAPNISPLLWSPFKPESPADAPLGVAGRPAYDTQAVCAPDGTSVFTSHFTQYLNSFEWQLVPNERYQTTSPPSVGGEYLTFFDQVLVRAGKFWLWRGIDEGSDTTPVTWTSALGPYVLRPGSRGPISPPFKRSAGFGWADLRNDVELDVLVTPEWETP